MRYIRNGATWGRYHEQVGEVRDSLPPGNYTVCFDVLRGYYLEESEPFADLPPKIYGKVDAWSERILQAFKDSAGQQIGVLLSGEKGSGKTLLAKVISVRSGLPTIIVNTPFQDDQFLRFMQEIDQPAVVIWDEFEKVFNKDQQDRILTLFDGVFTVRNKIMILTVNYLYQVQDFFHNRPGRIRYALEFQGLDVAFIKDYCTSNLKDASYLEDIIKVSVGCIDFNFDMLQALVRELNAYGGTVEEATEILNVKPHRKTSEETWDIEVTSLGRKGVTFAPCSIRLNPLLAISNGENSPYIQASWEEEGGRAQEGVHVTFDLEGLRKADPESGKFLFGANVEFDDIDDGAGLSLPVEILLRRRDKSGASWKISSF